MTAIIQPDLRGTRIINMAEPTSPTDSVNRRYIDELLGYAKISFTNSNTVNSGANIQLNTFSAADFQDNGFVDLTSIPSPSSFSVVGQTTGPSAIRFSPSGDKMFVLGFSPTDALFQYSLGTPFDTRGTVTLDGGFTINEDGQPLGFDFDSTGTKLIIAGNVTDTLYQYTLGTSFDITGAVTLDGGLDISAQDTGPTGVIINGNTLYFCGASASDAIHQYSLGTTDDITGTVTYDGAFSYAVQDGQARDFFINNAGDKMFIIGDVNDKVYQYTITTPGDITGTVTFDGEYSIASEDSSPRGLTFSTTGNRMYIVGLSSRAVHQYELPNVFDITNTGLATGAKILRGGIYELTFSPHYENVSSKNNNPGASFTVNGVAQKAIGASNFIADAQGHLFSGASVCELLQINAGDVVGIEHSQYGNNGDVVMVGANTTLSIKKLS